MTKRKISPKSLKNLYQSNQEANQITRESIETALLQFRWKKGFASDFHFGIGQKSRCFPQCLLPQLQV